MAQYVIDTSDEQEGAITMARLESNKTQVQQFADNATYVLFHTQTSILGPLVERFVESRVQVIADAYRKAEAKDRSSVDDVLKVAKG